MVCKTHWDIKLIILWTVFLLFLEARPNMDQQWSFRTILVIVLPTSSLLISPLITPFFALPKILLKPFERPANWQMNSVRGGRKRTNLLVLFLWPWQTQFPNYSRNPKDLNRILYSLIGKQTTTKRNVNWWGIGYQACLLLEIMCSILIDAERSTALI